MNKFPFHLGSSALTAESLAKKEEERRRAAGFTSGYWRDLPDRNCKCPNCIAYYSTEPAVKQCEWPACVARHPCARKCERDST